MFLWTLLFCCVLSSQAANILFANTWHSKSHARTMMYLAERLVERGHNVSMYSQVQSTLGPMGKGVHTLESILKPSENSGDRTVVDWLFWYGEMMPSIFVEPHLIGLQYLKFLQHDETFLKVLDTSFDLVFVDEMFATGQAALAFKLKQKFGTKIAVFSTTDLFSQFSMYRGLSRNPVTFPNYYEKSYSMEGYDERIFPRRLMTFIDVILEQYYTGVLANGVVAEAGALLGVKCSHNHLYDESVLSIIDYPARYGSPTPRSNDLVYVGEHCPKSRPLPEDFREFVEDPKSKGTIYVAFGSIVNWMAGPKTAVTTFVDVLNSLPEYRVIWSYAGPELNNTLPHIRLSKWAPQNDILAHPKTVLFFTHGGLKSLKEGICGGIPLLFLPFFADQPKNALYAINMGIAEAIYKGNITYDEMYAKINRALHSKTMKKNIEKLHSHFEDNVIPALDLGAFWAERVIKQRKDDTETRKFAIKGRWLSWISFLQLDIISILCVVIWVVSQ